MKLQWEDIEFLTSIIRKLDAEEAATLMDILIRLRGEK